MNGMLNIIMVCVTVVVAVMTYQIKFKARTLELEIHALRKDNKAIKSELMVLRAEQAYFSRPERIERLSKKFLKLSREDRKNVISSDVLASQNEEFQSRRAAQQALEAMVQKDNADRAVQNKAPAREPDSVGALVETKTTLTKRTQTTVSNMPVYAPQEQAREQAEGQVMGFQGTSEEQGQPQETIEAPKEKRQPAKPEWTPFGGLGEDD